MHIARFLPVLLVLSAGANAGSTPREEGVGAWDRVEHAMLRLVSVTRAIAPGQGEVGLGVHMRLDQGWNIYWRSPGTGGLPPQFDWAGSSNLARTLLSWPAPVRFESFGKQSNGYRDEVVFPVTARLQRPGEPVQLHLTVTFLICREVCMLGESMLSLALPAGDAALSEAAPLIARFRARVPVAAGGGAGITLAATTDAQGLQVTARAAAPFTAPDLFLEGPVLAALRHMALPAPRVTLGDGGHAAVFHFALPAAVAAQFAAPDTALVATLADATGSVEAPLTVMPGLAAR